MEYPAIPPAALKQIVDEVREQLDASRNDLSGLHESQVHHFNSRLPGKPAWKRMSA